MDEELQQLQQLLRQMQQHQRQHQRQQRQQGTNKEGAAVGIPATVVGDAFNCFPNAAVPAAVPASVDEAFSRFLGCLDSRGRKLVSLLETAEAGRYL
jgi:hypothetical protein